ESVALATPVHVTSMLSGSGVDELYAYLNDHSTVALLGSSGVGKSTLINALDGKSLQETSEVRNDGKGRHTTTRRQLIRLSDGGSIVDTPGLREIQLWNGDVGLSVTFEDVETFARQCRFSDCRHAGEPGCAVTEAVVQGTLSRERCASYQKLQRELAHLERKTDALARKAEKQRHKSVMKSLRRHPKHQR
ncbi:MAG: ribosome small subunit-dependent GTPase A, partial [Planctomycetota bacterium]